jgi:hypothetical protein
MQCTPVTRVGVPVIWYICLGNPEYNNPRHQEKAIKQKKFAYQEFDSSLKDKLFAHELRAKAKEIRSPQNAKLFGTIFVTVPSS